jgi:hypothetical protein
MASRMFGVGLDAPTVHALSMAAVEVEVKAGMRPENGRDGAGGTRSPEEWLKSMAGASRPSRRVVGWAMATHLRTELAVEALNIAQWQRRPSGVIHHSDQRT